MRKIALIAHDLRSAHNVGSLLRTAEGLGIQKVFLTDYTPYPLAPNDTRLPHLSQKIDQQINKTALGAQKTLDWEYLADINPLLDNLEEAGYTLAALEQSAMAVKLPDYKPPGKIAIVLGSEVAGLSQALLDRCSVHLEIPMYGSKESFNVVQAAAMALYHCRIIK